MLSNLAALIGILLFLASVIAVEVLRRKTTDPATSWVSTYLTGPWSFIEDIGFVILGITLLLFPHGNWLLGIAGVGTLLSMLSRRFGPVLIHSAEAVTRIHVVSSGFAFVGAFIGLAATAHVAPLVVLLLTLLVIGLVYIIRPKAIDIQPISEKLATFGISLAALTALV